MTDEKTRGGEWLKATRRSRCISQEELAEMIGTRFNTVSLWERGVMMPRLRNQRLIAEALRVSTEEVSAAFGGE